ncbi:hypothetical protein RJO52_000684 [Enterobacter hormaechei]|jgi:hypothetical protein|nr:MULTISPECIES: hypothetical protein [Enterobacter cloacae complex]MBS0853082.1 hypothetical protein [Enterobacter sp. JGM127]HAS0861464.1 hypothetical protein [Enterobacter hormaechei subsp. xiangfangensis]ELC6281954.1 hypothetical protein [Enterobacter hormaechei]ELC6370930.1 hypothetical protein [Enterobacter hormaechei]ELC6574831.1 hypothetical protein [Enterobacter hormaechei]
MTTKIYLLITAVLLLSACDNGPAPAKSTMAVSSQLSSDADRIKVTKMSEFRDGLAYDNWRGVYLIQDKQTGREYIGISGIGISEVGSHSQLVGKVQQQVRDER